jgi:hypothetical protein
MSAKDSAQTVEILEKLKSAILNIEWEISDENIGLLNQELAALRGVWRGQKVHMIYLQILGALIQYVASTKEQGNPRAFPMLRTAFDSLEDMVVHPGDEEQKAKKVMEHVDAYNELKRSLGSGKSAPAPAPAPKTEPKPEPESELKPEPEPKVVETKEHAEEQPSTINRLLHDKEDHTTDSIFDSMLDEMVQTEPAEQKKEQAPPDVPPPGKAPAARPAVHASYNKDDGTEIEADRNIDDKFVEADELLDNFFVDDVPAPGASARAKKGGGEFDLSALDEEEEEVLDLDQVPKAAEEVSLQLSLDDEEYAAEEIPKLEHVEDSELDIFKVDADIGAPQKRTEPEVAVAFPEMESTLDDFFDGNAAPDATDSVLEEALELEVLPKSVAAPVAAIAPSGTVAGLKTLLLSVNWEVDDQLLVRVDAEISALSTQLKSNNVALIHLNFLHTVIHHIGREQSQVIAESMACLKMVTESLEDLLSAEAEEEAIYAAKAAAAFVDWHELVVAEFEKRFDAVKRQGGDLAKSIKGLELESTEGDTSETQKMKKEILTEVREILSREMQAMRRELSAKD